MHHDDYIVTAHHFHNAYEENDSNKANGNQTRCSDNA
jgi:hypothetical protein